MQRATERARETARRFGTPIYVIKDGRVVSEIVGDPQASSKS